MRSSSAIVTALFACLTILPWVAPSLVVLVVGPDIYFGEGNWGGPDERGRYVFHSTAAQSHSIRTNMMLSGGFAAFGIASLLWTIRRPRNDRSSTP